MDNRVEEELKKSTQQNLAEKQELENDIANTEKAGNEVVADSPVEKTTEQSATGTALKSETPRTKPSNEHRSVKSTATKSIDLLTGQSINPKNDAAAKVYPKYKGMRKKDNSELDLAGGKGLSTSKQANNLSLFLTSQENKKSNPKKDIIKDLDIKKEQLKNKDKALDTGLTQDRDTKQFLGGNRTAEIEIAAPDMVIHH